MDTVKSGEIYRESKLARLDKSRANSFAELSTAKLDDNRLVFQSSQSISNSARVGVFFLEIPGNLELDTADEFSRTFYLKDGSSRFSEYREITPEHLGDTLLGYHSRVDQIEQFLLERRFWARYPKEIQVLGNALTEISELVIRHFLNYCGLPDRYQSVSTGGCLEQKGSYHFTFNHYRSEKNAIGLSAHKDDGFVSIIRAAQPGLEVFFDGEWKKVPSRPDCFVVNFGLAMEILTKHCKAPVSAVLHRVRSQKSSRSSFGHFSSSSCIEGADRGIFQFTDENMLVRVCSSRELIDANDEEIYFGNRHDDR